MWIIFLKTPLVSNTVNLAIILLYSSCCSSEKLEKITAEAYKQAIVQGQVAGEIRTDIDPGMAAFMVDNLLMSVLPYGRTVIGFANSDAHDLEHIDTSFSIYMMDDNSVESVKEAMQSGTFFPVTRKLRGNDIIGPAKEIDASVMDAYQKRRRENI